MAVTCIDTPPGDTLTQPKWRTAMVSDVADRMLYASDVRRSLGEWLDEHRPEIGRRYRALWIESKCITAARALISDANRTPYAGDPDLKEIRVAAGAALDELQHALWQRSWKEGGW